MVKKISALVLALVLCLSVVVVPASAAVELGDATIAFALEWDKAAYSAGETAILSVYMDGDDSLEFTTGSILIGLSSDVFDPTIDEHQTSGLRENTTMPDWMNAWYKDPSSQMSQLASTVVPKVEAANTADENAAFDWYVKFTAGKNTGGWHDNTGSTKNGFPGYDFDPSEPILQISLVVREDVADGTPAVASITSGSLKSNPVQTSWKYLKNPGGGTTTNTVAATAFDVSAATNVTAVIGEAGPTFPETSIVNPLKGQIRFHKDENGTYDGGFDIRALAVISGTDFKATFGTEAAAESMIKEAGFVFAAGSNVAAPSFADVKALVEEGTAVDGYAKKTVGFISSSTDPGNYVFSCIVTDMTKDADYGNSLVAVGYIAYEVDGVMNYAYYPSAQTFAFAPLFDTYFPG